MFRVMNQIFLEDMQGYTIEDIPLGNWLVRFDDVKGIFYLDKANDFSIPSKIYGNSTELATRYIHSYTSWNGNLGVLLSGMKGTGKSLLAKQICSMAELPVIMIQHAYGGSAFLSFLSKISQPIIIFLDEFEKVYRDDEQQNMLLSILDGTFNSKFLFLLTINEVDRMNNYMMNRPSRIHYHQKYKGMSDDMVKEISLDLLDVKAKVDDILTVCTYIGDISMDILISLINEVNLYKDESPMEVLEYMNLEPSSTRFKVKIIRDDKVMVDSHYTYNNPLMGTNIYLDWYGENIETLDNDLEDSDGSRKDSDGSRKDSDDSREDSVVDCLKKETTEVHNPNIKVWNELRFDSKDATIKINNGVIRVEYKAEYDDNSYVAWVLIYTRSELSSINYFGAM